MLFHVVSCRFMLFQIGSACSPDILASSQVQRDTNSCQNHSSPCCKCIVATIVTELHRVYMGVCCKLWYFHMVGAIRPLQHPSPSHDRGYLIDSSPSTGCLRAGFWSSESSGKALDLEVSWNTGTPKSSILMVCSCIFLIYPYITYKPSIWGGTPWLWNPPFPSSLIMSNPLIFRSLSPWPVEAVMSSSIIYILRVSS